MTRCCRFSAYSNSFGTCCLSRISCVCFTANSNRIKTRSGCIFTDCYGITFRCCCTCTECNRISFTSGCFFTNSSSTFCSSYRCCTNSDSIFRFRCCMCTRIITRTDSNSIFTSYINLVTNTCCVLGCAVNINGRTNTCCLVSKDIRIITYEGSARIGNIKVKT